MGNTEQSRGNGQTIAGIERAVDVLDLFLADGVRDLGVTEIAERLNLSKAVVHRVLSSFRSTDLVEVDEATRRYRLGVRALQFGMAYLRNNDALEIARGQLAPLCDATQETATMSVRVKWRRTYVAQVTPVRDIKMEVQIGASYPLHAGASSRAILAHMSDEFQQSYLAQGELESLTQKTIVSVGTLRAQLEQVRLDGFARSDGERQAGAASVAAPIFDATGEPVAAISICGPEGRMADEAAFCTERLLEVTREISRRLGHLSA